MKTWTSVLAIVTSLAGSIQLAHADAAWDAVLAKARGETVYWNAWGGDERTNGFIAWVGDAVAKQYGITLEQVKLTDTGEAVARVIAEKAAGRNTDGTVDMIWINGPNFLSMKEKGLLFGPFVHKLPNAPLIDTVRKASNVTDFTEPVNGMESPWRLAQFVFIYDSAKVPVPPRNLSALADWIKSHPGRFTHPDPKDFMGASFLKQALIVLVPHRERLAQPVIESNFAAETASFWAWYDLVRPFFWRHGEQFPVDGPAQRRLMNDSEVDFSMAFDPADAAASVDAGRLQASARVTTLADGSIGNTSFVAIPYNSPHTAGAMVIANFLLDPETQAHAQDFRTLGAFNVLDNDKLSPAQQKLFDDLPISPSLPTAADLSSVLLEPHPSWMTRIADEWRRRYAH